MEETENKKTQRVIGVFKEYIIVNGKRIFLKRRLLNYCHRKESFDLIKLSKEQPQRYSYKVIEPDVRETKIIQKMKERGEI